MNPLSPQFILSTKQRIESEIVPTMEKYYSSGKTGIPEDFRPNLKYIERVVSYYDYYACGLSVLAPMAANGNPRAQKLVNQLLKNMEHYRTHIYAHIVQDMTSPWLVPLRRLLFHAALAFKVLEKSLPTKQKNNFRKLLEEQTEIAIEHNLHFYLGEKNLHLSYINNHGAIFMQAILKVGEVLKNNTWIKVAKEAATRLYKSGHPDGYWEEHTSLLREGGPSMVYTPLTAGCLFDILDGKSKKQKPFFKAGEFFRSFLNFQGCMIPLADERTNCHERNHAYGLALHALTPEGRGHIVEMISGLEWNNLSPEGLAVLYYELDLMQPGPCAAPEYKKTGTSRITLPLGIVRKNGWTAGLSGLRSLNKLTRSYSEYALDHQNFAYLSHEKCGIILSGVKSKNDHTYSTFCRGLDAYTLDTGVLKLGKNWAEASLFYTTYEATLRWELGEKARLILETKDIRNILTTLPITDPKFAKSKTPFEVVQLKGFSSYSAGNADTPVTAIRFAWKKRLVVEFSM